MNVPPPETEPVARVPVEKLREPREPPFAEVAYIVPHVKLVSCDPFEVIVDEPIVPNPPVRICDRNGASLVGCCNCVSPRSHRQRQRKQS